MIPSFFFTWERSLVIKIIRVLKEYASTSGKMINKYKRCFYLHEKHFLLWKIRLRRFAGIRQRTFPFLHLGCPIFYGRSISRYFEDLIRKVSMIIFSWHNISLSFGGNYVHVNHVLNSMLVYLLSTMNPTKKVMDQNHQIFTKFFWEMWRELKVNTGWHGGICVFQKMKVELDLGRLAI